MGVENGSEHSSKLVYRVDYDGFHYKEQWNGDASRNGKTPAHTKVNQEAVRNGIGIPRGYDGDYSADEGLYRVIGQGRTIPTHSGPREASVVVHARRWARIR